VDFVSWLTAEFDRRRAANARYSLRRFAQALGTSHSLLSRLCRRRRRPLPTTVAELGPRLGLSAMEVAAAIREHQMDRLCEVVGAPRFSPDARWLAARANLSLDEVQVALQEALRRRRLSMTGPRRWSVED
jgi:transcriptional regulator with XRE-family HTH domain